jgi:outer membrane protein
MSFRGRSAAVLLASALAVVTRTANAQSAERAVTGAPAPDPSLRTFALEEALTYARAHQPELRAAVARVAAEQQAAEVPRAEWYPIVGATAQLFGGTANNTTGTYVVPGASIDIPRIGGTRSVSSGTWRPYPSTIAGVGLNQELFDFGRIAARAAAADARVDIERQRSRSMALEVTFDVQEAYFAVLAAKAVLVASNDAYERARVHRDLAKAGVDAGLRSPIEATRAEADLTRFDIGRIRAQGGLETARAVFAATVGVDDAALDAGPAPTSPADTPALERAIQLASGRDPRVQEAIARIRAEEQRTRAIGAELRPDISLTGTLTGRAGGAPPSGNGEAADANGWLPNVPNWDVGIVLSWPLFDGVISARKEASRSVEEVRRQELLVVRAQEIAVIRQAYARFRSGLGTSVELADAEALRTDAEIQVALGEFQLARARSQFGRAISEGM